METFRITDLCEPRQSPALLALIEQTAGGEFPWNPESLKSLAQAQLDVPLADAHSLAERYSALFDEIASNSSMHSAGRFMLQQVAVTGLIQSSRLEHLHATEPAVRGAEIKAPLVVAGMPRSGTTYLLQLLATEPGLQSLARWECSQMIPSRDVLLGTAEDQRQAQGEQQLALLASVLPNLQYMYDVEPSEATEEIEAMLHGCHGVGFSFWGDSPQYDNAFYDKDQSDAYHYLYRILQAQSWLKKISSDRKWLLKSPQHMGALPELDGTFPDAAIVFTHRDPASVFASLITLLGYTARFSYSRISKEQLLDRARRMQHGFLKGLVAHADRFAGRSEHVYFHELMQDYQTTLERIYSIAGLKYDDAARARISQQAAAYGRGRKGKRLVYSLQEDFGISRAEIRDEFSYYLERFPVEIEDTQQ